jgi:hypothetical protein
MWPSELGQNWPQGHNLYQFWWGPDMHMANIITVGIAVSHNRLKCALRKIKYNYGNR